MKINKPELPQNVICTLRKFCFCDFLEIYIYVRFVSKRKTFMKRIDNNARM